MRYVLGLGMMLLFAPVAPAAVAPAPQSCDGEALSESKAEFRRLVNLRRKTPGSVSDEDLREASRSYIADAESCYQALYGSQSSNHGPIDDGGVWFGRSKLTPRHNLFGTKWGAGTSFLPTGDNLDAIGPRTAGGVVSYSFMADAVDLSPEIAGMPGDLDNVAVTSLPDYAPCFLREISDAFGAWSAVADIDFVPVTDDGAPFDGISGVQGAIRIGAHPFDGPSGTLAHGFFPPPNGFTAAGDIHFDSGELWDCSTIDSLAQVAPQKKALLDPALRIGLIALHEIGHAIGLGHEPGPAAGDRAVMNPFIDDALSGVGLLADDMLGIWEIYGANPVADTFFFGNVGIGTDEPTESIHVRRDDGTAKLLVEEASSTNANRTLLELINNGRPRFTLTDSDSGNSWRFAVATNSFRFSRVGTGFSEFMLDESGNVTITGVLTENSNRFSKENITPVDVSRVLGKVAQIPIAEWNYKTDETRHVSPMAQDFFAAFGLGRNERGVASLDLAGVAIASTQALYRQATERDSRIKELLEENSQLEARIAAIAERLARLEKD